MKKTKSNKAHYALEGKMIDFFGWDLPVQYSGLTSEHIAVRTTAGIFDVSHMGEIFIEGESALEAVQFITSNNVNKLTPGRIHYTALPTENGCFVDDMLVYMISEKEFLLVVNAANLEKDFKWITGKLENHDVNISNKSEEYSQVAIQGPLAEKLLSKFTDNEINSMKYYSFIFGEVNGISSIISRTGYTGEDGFEVYFKSGEEEASGLFLKLAEEGKEMGILPAGLGARDTLRLESKMALYGNDIDDSHTILEADLGWILKLKKGDFIGREILLKQKEEGIKRKLAGFEMIGRGIARHGYPVFIDNIQFSTVTSGTYAPYLKKAIGLTYLPVNSCETGTIFQIGIREKKIDAKVVETPFYKRK